MASTYFTYFPKIGYDLENTNEKKQLTNILRRFAFNNDNRDKLNTYYTYTIQAGDRPDTIAEKYYGDASLDWVVLHYNYILNPLFDFPLFGEDFSNYVAKKYGSLKVANETVLKYFKVIREKQKDARVDIPELVLEIDETTYNTLLPSQRRSYTAYEWELELNDRKSEIKLLDKIYLDILLQEVETILQDTI